MLSILDCNARTQNSQLEEINKNLQQFIAANSQKYNLQYDRRKYSLQELLGSEPTEIKYLQGKTISAKEVKRILKKLKPDSNPEQLLRQLREKDLINPYKSKYSSKLSGKYYLSSILDYLKSLNFS